MQNAKQACSLTVFITSAINKATSSQAGSSYLCTANAVGLGTASGNATTTYFRLTVPAVHPWIELQ